MVHAARKGIGGFAIIWEQHTHELWKEHLNLKRNKRSRYGSLLGKAGVVFLFAMVLRWSSHDMAQTHESYAIQEIRPRANNLLRTPGVAKALPKANASVTPGRDDKASKRKRLSHGDRARKSRLAPCSIDVSEDALTLRNIAAVRDRLKAVGTAEAQRKNTMARVALPYRSMYDTCREKSLTSPGGLPVLGPVSLDQFPVTTYLRYAVEGPKNTNWTASKKMTDR